MSKKSNTEAVEDPATTPPTETPLETAAPAPELVLKVRIALNGLSIAGGVAAEGAVLHVPQSVAVFHEGRGELKIIGTA